MFLSITYQHSIQHASLFKIGKLPPVTDLNGDLASTQPEKTTLKALKPVIESKENSSLLH